MIKEGGIVYWNKMDKRAQNSAKYNGMDCNRLNCAKIDYLEQIGVKHNGMDRNRLFRQK